MYNFFKMEKFYPPFPPVCWFFAILYPCQKGGYAMQDGYYWIKFRGIVQKARYSDIPITDIETGGITRGVWHLMGEDIEICSTSEAVVLSGILGPGVQEPG